MEDVGIVDELQTRENWNGISWLLKGVDLKGHIAVETLNCWLHNDIKILGRKDGQKTKLQIAENIYSDK